MAAKLGLVKQGTPEE